MIQVKFFKIEDWEACNEFMKTTRPRGEKGFVVNAHGFVVVYEEGIPMDKYDRLNKLKFQLGEHKEKIMAYQKESLLFEAMQEEYLSRPEKEVNQYQKNKFKEQQEAEKIAKKKMIVMEELSVSVTEKLIKEEESKKK